MSLSALTQLAAAHGIETEYIDDRGARHTADPESLIDVLRVVGAPVARLSDAPAALRAERRRRQDVVIEPVTAARADQPVSVAVRLPEALGPGGVRVELRAEDGSKMAIAPEQVTRLGSQTVEGGPLTEWRIKLSGPGLPPLQPGYYELTVDWGSGKSTGTLVVAPPCPSPGRGWGAFLTVQSFRSSQNSGVGTYRELSEVARWIADLGGSFLGTLPLFPTFLDAPFEPSPYLPVTRLGWHEVFIDPGSTPESASSSAADAPGPTVLPGRLDELRSATSVDYAGVANLVRQTLEPMARSAAESESPRRRAMIDFARARPDLAAYAQFRSAREQGRAVPPRRERTAVVDFDSLDERGRFHLYAQLVAEEQLEASEGRLYLDLPVGVHPDGFDAWWEADVFTAGVEGGAPPDAFFSSGQTWGFRPLHPRKVREDRYRYPISCLRQVMRHATVVRIDHVMGLHRLFWVPEGASPEVGVYVRYRLDEMMAIVALEATRADCSVVGEDLGTVPDVVRQAMGSADMLRSWVFQFEASPKDPLPDPPEQVMASFGTHDLPRFASFWEGQDIDEAVERGAQSSEWAAGERVERQAWRRSLDELSVGDPAEPAFMGLRVCLDHLASGPARLVMVDLEDLWLEPRQINRPGSSPSAGNWAVRMARTLDDMESEPAVVELLAGIAERRRGPRAAGAHIGRQHVESLPGTGTTSETRSGNPR